IVLRWHGPQKRHRFCAQTMRNLMGQHQDGARHFRASPNREMLQLFVLSHFLHANRCPLRSKML
ncbi:MAG TPA: hypothetical protein VGO06_04415, partial [Bosea sp. (in: a-proteobacteria)]|uniref:hypothetical protein n=1 Tax=Bosea sp. (in: a-proteobacteria) TaxID=1871050 RepID=UPI002E0FBA13|nr:hypothetical protein [Bosea sp. (in: a-proteobacteria)]